MKISVPLANALLRKVWIRLEKACKQENVKRYQIEASTPMTPVKEKPCTKFRRAREMVREMKGEQEERKSQEKKKEGNQMPTEEGASLGPLAKEVWPEQLQHEEVELLGGLPGSQVAAVLASLQESRETGTPVCTRPGRRGQLLKLFCRRCRRLS